MANTVYFNSTNPSTGDGSFGNPFRSFGSYTAGQGDVLRFSNAGTWGQINPQWMQNHDIDVDAYGTGSRLPMITMMRTVAPGSWVGIGNNTYYCIGTGPGMVLRGGRPLKRINHDGSSNVAAKIASMPLDSHLIDFTSTPWRAYIRISGSLSSDILEVTDDAGGTQDWRGTALFGYTSADRIAIRNLHVRGAPRNGLLFQGSDNFAEGLTIEFCGGKWDSGGYWLGNGVEFGGHASRSKFNKLRILDVFDSSISPQNYVGGGVDLKDWEITNCYFKDWGLAAIEISTQQGAGSFITGGLVEGNEMYDGGPWWAGGSSWADSPNNSGYGINIQSNQNGTGNIVTGVKVRRNIIGDATGGIQLITFGSSSCEFTGNKAYCSPGRARRAAGFMEQFWATSSHLVAGNVFSGFDVGIAMSRPAGGSSAITLQNNSILACPVAVQMAPGVSLPNMANNLVQGASTGVINGGSASGRYNYLATDSTLGGYALGTGDQRGAAISVEAAPSFAALPNSPIYGMGASTGRTYVDPAGNTFGAAGTWAIGGYAKYSSGAAPAPTPAPTPAPAPAPSPSGTPVPTVIEHVTTLDATLHADGASSASISLGDDTLAGDVVVLTGGIFRGTGNSEVELTSSEVSSWIIGDEHTDPWESTNKRAFIALGVPGVQSDVTVSAGFEADSTVYMRLRRISGIKTTAMPRATGVGTGQAGGPMTIALMGDPIQVGDTIVLSVCDQSFLGVASGAGIAASPGIWLAEADVVQSSTADDPLLWYDAVHEVTASDLATAVDLSGHLVITVTHNLTSSTLVGYAVVLPKSDVVIPPVDPGTPPVITSTSLPSGFVGAPYSATVTATGTATVTVTASGLPAGLSIAGDGTISGTPTLAGSYSVQLNASNGSGTASTVTLQLVIGSSTGAGTSTGGTKVYRSPPLRRAGHRGHYRRALLSLLPQGKAWPRDEDSVLSLLALGLATVYERTSDRAGQLVVDAFPATTVELLGEWESTLGLPDPCAGDNPTLQQRVGQVVSRLLDNGGQSLAALQSFAADLGYTVTVTNDAPFRVGQSHVGDHLGRDDWSSTWAANAALVNVIPFRVGRSAVGEPLASWGNETLECELAERAPAHSVPQFRYS